MVNKILDFEAPKPQIQISVTYLQIMSAIG